MHRDGEVSLVEAMTTIKAKQEELQRWSEVVQPLADMVEPPAEGVEPRPLLERIRDAPVKITSYVQGMVKFVSIQLLSFVKSLYPKADLCPIAEGIARDCSDEAFQRYMEEMDLIDEEISMFINL